MTNLDDNQIIVLRLERIERFIDSEYKLMTERLNALLVFSGFLFSVLAFLYRTNAAGSDADVLVTAVLFLGVTTSGLAGLGIKAGLKEATKYKFSRERIAKEAQDVLGFEVLGTSPNSSEHLYGVLVLAGFPLVLIVSWVALALMWWTVLRPPL